LRNQKYILIGAGGMAQMVEWLPCEQKVLSSNPSMPKKREQNWLNKGSKKVWIAPG
jgi:hypothetical protein